MMEETIHHLNKIEFSVYTPDELKKMSVSHITLIESFDPEGNAVKGGLYDKKLGPAKRSDKCDTCGRMQQLCEGHVGHIQLPLPVYNPIFIRNVVQLLKITCFNCHRLMFQPESLAIFLVQLEAVDRGYDYLVDEISDQAQMMMTHLDGQMNSIEHFQEKLRSIITESITRDPNASEKPLKCFVDRKNRMLKQFLSNKAVNIVKNCRYCSEPRHAVNLINNQLIMCNKMKGRGKAPPIVEVVIEGREEDEVDTEASGTLLSTVESQGQFSLDADEGRKILRDLWNNEKKHLRVLYPFLGGIESNSSYEHPIDAFFWEVINVASTKFKPLRELGDRKCEDDQRAHLKQILKACLALQGAFENIKSDTITVEEVVTNETTDPASVSTITPINRGKKKTPTRKVEMVTKLKDASHKKKDVTTFHYAWQRVQNLCNRLFDSDMDRLTANNPAACGVRQVIEKKEGLFRLNMMGKRVNFSARSVISPDPYITANEVGIPVIFAVKLTYPEPVNHHNLAKMKAAILNGPDAHPGAESVILDDGCEIRLKANDAQQRIVLSERLVSSVYRSERRPIVKRHLVTGDVLLFNRQPTLHKPSIMAHVARVLPNERTLRLHYSNCKSYNADFDGDEMNAHFPQSELARAEAYEIASVNHQYLVPKDGTPLSGLIQDHIVSATLFSTRGVFFDETDYNELLFSSLSFLNRKIITLPPTILKPRKLWSGKQLVTSLIINVIPRGQPFLTAEYPAKVKEKSLITGKKKKSYHSPVKPGDMCESHVIIQDGHHLTGVIDKSSIGNSQYGLIHLCYELYGGSVSTNLITAFARLATHYLQCHVALTLGIEDILVVKSADKKRTQIVQESTKVGMKAAATGLALEDEANDEEKLKEKVQMAHLSKDPLPIKLLDGGYKQIMDSINNDISGACLGGLIKKFPSNNLQLMIQTGAKGGTVNALQISCLLGQIELEGKRPPMMMSGKTLPSFAPYDMSPRAGGFITGRFLTGIKPQEFFFHCMAGREGLIDTAVKTSRSGYLQRCIIKHLEGLVVNYDLTVRDSDGSIVQFIYGEDGLDVTKCQLLTPKTLNLIEKNISVIKPSTQVEEIINEDLNRKRINNRHKRIARWQKYNGNDRTKLVRGSGFLDFALGNMRQAQEELEEMSSDAGIPFASLKGNVVRNWFTLSPAERKIINERYSHCPDPVNHLFSSASYHGVISEKMSDIINDYIDTNIVPSVPSTDDCDIQRKIDQFKHCFYSRYIKSLAEPGEAVGLLAAQSIGEPSTQMTLNTFHFAGRGEMNVTLGIPRLREIIMTASKNISTPSMDIPFKSDVTHQEAAATRLLLNSVRLSDVLADAEINESLILLDSTGNRSPLKRNCQIKFNFLKYKYYKGRFNVTPEQVLKYLESKYIEYLCDVITKKIAALRKTNSLYDHSVRMREGSSSKSRAEGDENGDGDGNSDNDEDPEDRQRKDREARKNARKAIAEDDEESSDDDDTGDPDCQDTLAKKKAARHNQDAEYEEPEEEDTVRDDEVVDDENDSADIDDHDKSISAPSNAADADAGNQSLPNSRASSPESKSKEDRVKHVLGLKEFIKAYDYDESSKCMWATVTLQLDLSTKLDFGSIIEETAKKSFVYRVGKINRAFLVRDNEAAKKNLSMDQMIKTEGVSFLTMIRFADTLDLNRMYSNDLHAIAETYGIEAAAQAIRREIKNVFAVYGIAVDPRHLSLVSDYMTLSGTVRGMNRDTMSSQASVIQQMTFETTTNFLKSATFAGFSDTLESPSARVFAGIPSKAGTGFFSLLEKPAPFIASDLKAEKSFNTSFGGRLVKSHSRSSLKKGKRRTWLVQPTVNPKRSKY